jgi:hypothetical protein
MGEPMSEQDATVTREEFRRNPGNVLRQATGDHGVVIIDNSGKPRMVLWVPTDVRKPSIDEW